MKSRSTGLILGSFADTRSVSYSPASVCYISSPLAMSAIRNLIDISRPTHSIPISNPNNAFIRNSIVLRDLFQSLLPH